MLPTMVHASGNVGRQKLGFDALALMTLRLPQQYNRMAFITYALQPLARCIFVVREKCQLQNIRSLALAERVCGLVQYCVYIKSKGCLSSTTDMVFITSRTYSTSNQNLVSVCDPYYMPELLAYGALALIGTSIYRQGERLSAQS